MRKLILAFVFTAFLPQVCLSWQEYSCWVCEYVTVPTKDGKGTRRIRICRNMCSGDE